MKTSIRLLGAAIALGIGSSNAALVAEYKFDGGATANSATSSLATTTAGTFGSTALKTAPTLGSTTLNGSNDWSPSSNGGGDYVYGAGVDLARNEADTVTAGNFFQFTITPTTQIDFTSLQLWARRNNSGIGNSTFFLRSSLDTYASTLATSTAAAYNTNASLLTPPVSLNLSGVGSLQNVSNPVIFRLYLFTSAGGSGEIAFDDVRVNAVPEPSVALLGAFGALALLRRRR